MMKKLFYFFLWPIFLFVINVILDKLGFYVMYQWIDIPMHFFGGAAIAYSFVLLFGFLKEKKLLKIDNKLIFVFLILSSVCLVAVLWEFYEFFLVRFFGVIMPNDLADTLMDLFMGLCGGLLVGLICKN